MASTAIAYPASSSFPPFDSNSCNANFGFNNVTPVTTSTTFEVTQDQTDYRVVYDQSGSLGRGYSVEKMATIIKISSLSDTKTWAEIFDNNCSSKAGIEVIWSNSVVQVFGGTILYPTTINITLDSGYYQVVLTNPKSTLSNSLDVDEAIVVTNYSYNEKAGIRVKDIKDYTDATTLALHKTYEYPSGRVISNPIQTYTSTQYSLKSDGYPTVSTILHRLSYTSGTDKPHIGYEEVVETVVDAIGTASNGKTTYTFNSAHYGNYFDGVYTYYINGKETSNQYSKSYELGKSSSNSVYDKNDNIISSSSSSYYDLVYYSNSGIYLHIDESRNDLFPIPTQNPQGQWYVSYIPYLKTPGLASVILGGSGGIGLQIPPDCLTAYVDSGIASDLCTPGIARLLKQTSKAWGKVGNITSFSSSQYYNAASDIVSQITNYIYYDVDELIQMLPPPKPPVLVSANYLLKETQTTNSKGEALKQEFLYADHVTGGAGSLKTNNMLAVPLETKIYKDGVLMSHKKTEYVGTLPNKIQTAKGAQTLEDRLLFERFENDNLVQVKQVDGTTTAYIWGYDNRYVIAKVENATYTDIENLSVFGTGFILTGDNLTLTQENALRGMTNVLVTTYVYDPMVGVTSITDPRGNTLTYEYDDFHRLKKVKDRDDKILSENKYNYGPQN